MEEDLKKEHPEWFSDFDNDNPIDEIEDPEVRAYKQIDEIYRKMNGLTERVSDLIDKKSESIEKNLISLPEKKPYFLIWIFLGVIIGYLISKL